MTKEQDPKEEEMKQMSEFVNKLEGYADLEVSIIRATKINKVLKAILKIPTIPKEDEFQFKPRSQSLLDKWNKLLASEQGTPAASAPPTTTNGIREDAKSEAEDTKATPTTTNGTKESSTDEKVEEKAPAVEEPVIAPKEEAPNVGDALTPSVEESAQVIQINLTCFFETLLTKMLGVKGRANTCRVHGLSGLNLHAKECFIDGHNHKVTHYWKFSVDTSIRWSTDGILNFICCPLLFP